MLHKTIYFFSDLGYKPLIFLGVILGSFSLMVYVFLGRGARESIVDQVIQRKIVMARSGAGSIKSFFDVVSESLVVLSRSLESTSDVNIAKKIMNQFIVDWKQTPLMGLSLTDKTGAILALSNRKGDETGLGLSLFDREYFQQVLATQQLVISRPFVSRMGVTAGEYVFSVSVPILDSQGKTEFVLVGVISLDRLTKQYIEPLKISDQGLVHILDPETATIVYSDDPTILGKNIFDSVKSQKFLGRDLLIKTVQDNLSQNREGSLRVAAPDQNGKLQPQLLVWSPISIGNKLHQIVILTPEAEILNLVAPFYIKNILLVYFGYLAVTTCAVWLARAYTRRQTIVAEHLLHQEKI